MVNLDSRDEIYRSWILLTIYPNLEPTDLPVEMVVLHNLCLPLQFKNSILHEALSVAAPLAPSVSWEEFSFSFEQEQDSVPPNFHSSAFAPPRSEKYSLRKKSLSVNYNEWCFVQQEFLKKEQERKEAELLAEKQEASRKRKEEKRIAREVTSKSFFQIFYFIS